MTFGEKLKMIRNERDLSLRQLAVLVNVSVAHLSKLERDESSPTLDVISKLTSALGVTVDVLTEDETDVKTLDLPESLKDFIEDYKKAYPILETRDWQNALLQVRLRGRYPDTSKDWLGIFLSIERALGEDK